MSRPEPRGWVVGVAAFALGISALLWLLVGFVFALAFGGCIADTRDQRPECGAFWHLVFPLLPLLPGTAIGAVGAFTGRHAAPLRPPGRGHFRLARLVVAAWRKWEADHRHLRDPSTGEEAVGAFMVSTAALLFLLSPLIGGIVWLLLGVKLGFAPLAGMRRLGLGLWRRKAD